MPASWDNYPPNYRPVTEADIFAAFEVHTTADYFIEDPEHPFGPDMSLYHWVDAVDDDFDRLDAFGGMRKWLMNTYQVRIDLREWRAFVRKPKHVTLGDVCRFTAERGGWMLDPKPLRVAGRECVEAGVFMTLRSDLTRAVAPDRGCAPSTPIDRVGRSNLSRFYEVLFRISPHHVSRIKVRCSWVILVLVYALLATLLLGCVNSVLWIFGAAIINVYQWTVIFCLLLILLVLSSWLPPRRVEIKGLKTMADLSREIARSLPSSR